MTTRACARQIAAAPDAAQYPARKSSLGQSCKSSKVRINAMLEPYVWKLQ